jgi:murein tripeptide amidase MpaA
VSYLNVEEVESALKGLAQQYPTVAALIELPYKSIEGRTCHALRIGTSAVSDGVLFTACAHAREWGGADICVYFAADLLEAYTAGTGLGYGGKVFSAGTIASIVTKLSVLVFPCVNPDGRKFDQAHPSALWRKNRNPKDSGGDPGRIGVDINRNHSFLWDFRTAFAPGAVTTFAGTLASDDPGNVLYHGSAPDSEPETRNIHWLLDTSRFVRWCMDIHSYGPDVLFSWGDDVDQSDTPSMNFLNSAWDGQRGLDGGYGEYIDSRDRSIVEGAAQRVCNTINTVRGGSYEAKQSVFLQATSTTISYPTSGAVDDYSYSRHWADCTRGKVYGFTLEFYHWTGDSQTSFHPPWPEMEQIVAEIDAGMVEFCLAAVPRFVPPWYVEFRRLWPWQIWDPLARLVEPIVRPLVERFLTGSRR